ncbi:hypothetical protein [Brevibacterium sp. ZH18]|uniref:hypothetical protein n=1 Tax=Brevibacterium sp. ZH18 TaxID=2927784 RepID=UPI001F60B5F8|nr:hypothetical protein [Brevibacterium sp. ZH18]MCI4010299.1 hypothetical protein [Brevibacterium sp. ZH18]
MRELIVSLVQSINGSYAQDGWSTGVSTKADFAYFTSLRRQAGAIIIDRRTALNPNLPVINGAGKALDHTPVHVLTESDPEVLAAQLAELGLDYRAHHFTPDTVAEVVESVEATSDTLVCESGPNLAYRLLDSYPGAQLHLSLSPRYSRNSGSHFCRLEADIDLCVIDVRTVDDQVFVRYAKA